MCSQLFLSYLVSLSSSQQHSFTWSGHQLCVVIQDVGEWLSQGYRAKGIKLTLSILPPCLFNLPQLSWQDLASRFLLFCKKNFIISAYCLCISFFSHETYARSTVLPHQLLHTLLPTALILLKSSATAILLCNLLHLLKNSSHPLLLLTAAPLARYKRINVSVPYHSQERLTVPIRAVLIYILMYIFKYFATPFSLQEPKAPRVAVWAEPGCRNEEPWDNWVVNTNEYARTLCSIVE